MEKRPLGIIGAIFFITMVVLSRFGMEKSLYILPLFLVAVFLVFIKQNKIKYFAVITSAILCACIVFHVADRNFSVKEEYFFGKNIAVEGVLYQKSYFDGEKYILYVETDKVNNQDVKMKIRVSSLTLPEKATLYNKVKFKANLYKTDSLESDVKSSYRAVEIALTGTCVKNSLSAYENTDKPFKYHILSYKYRLTDAIWKLLPNDIGAFIAGIAFGEKDLMSAELKYKFDATGTSHILVVSGLHVAIWSGFLFFIFRKFLSDKIASLISIFFIIVFMVFTGFTPSVVRAGTMMIMNYIARMSGEKPDSLNTLGIAALVLTAIRPFSVYSVGTVFSFASVFGILLMNEYINPFVKNFVLRIKLKLISKVVYYIIGTILVTLSAQIFTFPISVLYNVYFSYISVIANFFISIFTTLVMVCGGFGTIFLLYAPEFILTKIILGTSIISSRFIIHIVDKLSVYDFLYRNVSTVENYLLLLLLMILLLVILFVNLPTKKKVTVFSLFIIPVILISNLVPAVFRKSTVEFSVIDVGDGMCVTFIHDGEAVMLGCGGDDFLMGNITEHLAFRKTGKIKALYLPVDRKAKLVSYARKIKEEMQVESVVTSSDYKFSFVSKNYTSADYVAAEYFLGKLRIDYFTDKNCSFALATVGKTRILINFYGSLKEELLPQGCINPDIYVTMYSNTYRTDFSATEEYIVTSDYSISVPASADNVHFTKNNSTYTKVLKP